MKVVVTANVHYGVGNNQHIVKNLAKRIIKTNADVLILAGDTFHFQQQLLIDCLHLFDARRSFYTVSFASFSLEMIHYYQQAISDADKLRL